MIHKISIENYFSVADPQEIVLPVSGNAPSLPCFRSSKLKEPERLPCVVGFFGPNASGKSTMLRALIAAITFTVSSFHLGIETAIPLFQPYKRKDWWDKPSKIIIDFEGSLKENDPYVMFRYELHIAHKKNHIGESVAYEALLYAPNGRFKHIFERNDQDFKFSSEFELSPHDPRIQTIRSNASVFSTLAQFNHQLSINFISHISNIGTNISGFDKIQYRKEQVLQFYEKNPDYLAELNKQLKRLDVGLEEMMIEKGGWAQQSPTYLVAQFKHTGLDGFITMDEESYGTRKFIEIFPLLQIALKTGSLAIIDEIDTDFHPLLLPELFRWFYDPERNPYGAQLFFTAHNPALLDELEKEQIFFTEKITGNPTEVYGARDIKGLRRGPSLMKKYLAGELGAIPYIG